MKIEIFLPKSSGFDIELDDTAIHSKYENFETSVFVSAGKHTIYAKDQAPTPVLWGKILKLLNPISQSSNDFSSEFAFCLRKNTCLSISLIYKDCYEVEFVPDEELSELL